MGHHPIPPSAERGDRAVSNQARRYTQERQVVIDHTSGTVHHATVLGGHRRLAETSVSKDHEGRMDALFAHQMMEPDAESLRFLRKG